MMQNFPNSEMIESCSVGVNVVLSDNWIAKTIKKMLVEGIETWAPRLIIKRAVVDFPSPNIAKELHVGHLRTCIIGDAIARLLEFSNVEVLRRNHVGDWGTQFGMLLELIFEENPNWDVEGQLALNDLAALYKKANARFKEDSDFKERAQKSVVRLQGGEVKYVKAWEKIREISRGAFNELFSRLGVQSEEMGESFYGKYIPEVLEALSDQVKDDDGTRVIFSEHLLGKGGKPLCLIVVKSDGGYSYDTTDLAALWYRVNQEKADWIIYVTDVGQKGHFQMVFEAAERAGWLPGNDPCCPKAFHVGFGLVQAEDGKRLRTRDSEVPRLVDLLDEAKNCSKGKILELIKEKKSSDQLSEDS
ncbi:hypothetical protein Ddye_020528 [Dipteronia dyeriana]|uniref:Arginyl-tRNA synthetase n=1 Tax=Dipteronia dyeriana TaxID=168575 RepID=A0AAD9WWN4_9ROSI|nr:hypothetical protein Ddye_020528 [Dipteronia dyeriana]